MNTSWSETIKTTPYEAVYGQAPPKPPLAGGTGAIVEEEEATDENTIGEAGKLAPCTRKSVFEILTIQIQNEYLILMWSIVGHDETLLIINLMFSIFYYL